MLIKRTKSFRTQDSALAFYQNQLEAYDPKLHEPLTSFTWSRDVKLRPGITLGQEATSFMLSSYGGVGTLQNNVGNFPWISAETTAIPGVSVNGKKVVLPLRLLAREVTYTSPELERSQNTNQPIDVQKLAALNYLYQMNTDQMVYIGSADVGATGLVNSPTVTATTVANGVSGSSLWINKTPDEILADINQLLSDTWAAAAYSAAPMKIGLPPAQFGRLAAAKVSSAGNVSVLNFLKQNTISMTVNGPELEIVPMKWLVGAGAGSTDRMIAYTNDENMVRFPMVPIRRETPYYQGIRYTAPYLWAFGEMEIVYPETIRYADGI